MMETVDDVRNAILKGNAEQFGADANVAARISADDHVRREKYLNQIEAQWGPAPGRQLKPPVRRSAAQTGQELGSS